MTLKEFFMSLNDEVMYAQSTVACCGSLSRFVGLLSKVRDVIFTAGVQSFPYHDWSYSKMCLYEQISIKPPDPETQMGFPGREISTCPCDLLLERKHVLCGHSREGLGSLCLTSMDSA